MTRESDGTWPNDALANVFVSAVGATAAEVDARGGVAYGELLAAYRLLQTRLAYATPPPEVVAEATAAIDTLNQLLAAFQVAEPDRWAGMRVDLPGRGDPLMPPYVIDEHTPQRLAGRVTFTGFHLGGNAAVHGGVLPLMFDDLLGRAINAGRPGVARTAYLKVNYRKVTPLNVELRFEVTCGEIAGRKRWAAGRLHNPAGDLLADAEGLFLELLPGQQ